MRKVPFITVEGVDGAGKSSHINDILEHLKSFNLSPVSTREPGGTDLGVKIREDILNTKMTLEAEVLLAFADRAEHIYQIIEPALRFGMPVVCDRFTDSTYAYQGSAGFPFEKIDELKKMFQKGLEPDLTLIFDLPVDVSMDRLKSTGKDLDKFESKSKEYFEGVREVYLKLAQENPHRIRIINSNQPIEKVKEDVKFAVLDFMMDFNQKHIKRNKHKI